VIAAAFDQVPRFEVRQLKSGRERMSHLTARNIAAPDSNELEPADRRTAERKSVTLRAQVIVPEQHILEGYAVDLSSGGVGVTVPFELAAGQECLVDLELAACGSSSAFQIDAIVRYCIPLGADRFRLGMKFSHLDDATAALIAAILK
jgi:c-di-GMP-binding flagellar brake protein YcgR